MLVSKPLFPPAAGRSTRLGTSTATTALVCRGEHFFNRNPHCELKTALASQQLGSRILVMAVVAGWAKEKFFKQNLSLTSFYGQWCQSREKTASVNEVFLHISSGFALRFPFKCHFFYCGYNWCCISYLNLTGDVDLISVVLMCFPAVLDHDVQNDGKFLSPSH